MLLVFVTVVLSACDSRERLYVLNWGEYMNPDLIRAFEEEHNVRVIYEEVMSNEAMENNLKRGTTNYDIMIPSEYMIDKLVQQNLLQPIQKDLLTNYASIEFFSDARALYENEPFGDYMIPYFFGTVGIMYNTSNPDIKAALESQENSGFCALFDPESPFIIGLYDSPRDTVGAALKCLGYSASSNVQSELLEAEELIRGVTGRADRTLTRFGTDGLKGAVALGNIDMALVYSGDYFEMIFEYEEEGQAINFDFYVPEHSNIWIDAFVIPKASQNVELAHKFIDFFLDIDNAVENADWVGYTPVIKEVYRILVEEYEYDYEHYYPQPEGSSREVYIYISEEHAIELNRILNAAKAQ